MSDGAYEHGKWCFQTHLEQQQITTKWCLKVQNGAFGDHENNIFLILGKFLTNYI